MFGRSMKISFFQLGLKGVAKTKNNTENKNKSFIFESLKYIQELLPQLSILSNSIIMK